MKAENKEQLLDNIKFNNSRTPFLINLLFQLFTTISLFLVILFFIGPDLKKYSWNYFTKLEKLAYLYLFLISLVYLLIIFLINLLFVLFKFIKPDSFTYSFGLAFVGILIIFTGDLFYSWNISLVVKTILRFILIIISMVLGVLIGTFISVIYKNKEYQKEEQNQIILKAYLDNQIIPTKKQLKKIKQLEYKISKQKEYEELLKFKEELYKKKTDNN
ncbi:hypothetical protein V2P43_02735 [Mycoplasma capricolum subsp. capricolum]|uniref:DxFTY motif-containing membrane protein n=1 Tax=Mycoplasma capricolum TaxID=2095 RepID=UPI003DA3AFA9